MVENDTSQAASAEPGTEEPISTAPIGTGFTISTTVPDELLRHDISDEELDLLCETRRDNIWEGLWIATGLALGGVPSTIPAVLTYVRGAKLQTDIRNRSRRQGV